MQGIKRDHTSVVEDPRRAAGYIDHRTNKRGDGVVILFDAAAQGIPVEDGGKYAVVCYPDAYVVQTNSKRDALRLICNSDVWCQHCNPKLGPDPPK